MCTPSRSIETAPGATHEKNRSNAAALAGCVVGAQVAGVPECLIERRLCGVKSAFDLQDGYAAALKNDHVRSTGIAGQLVFEDRGVFTRRGVAHFQFPALALQPGDGLVPGADLLGRSIGNELLQLKADDTWLCAGEAIQAGLPSVSVIEVARAHGWPG